MNKIQIVLIGLMFATITIGVLDESETFTVQDDNPDEYEAYEVLPMWMYQHTISKPIEEDISIRMDLDNPFLPHALFSRSGSITTSYGVINYTFHPKTDWLDVTTVAVSCNGGPEQYWINGAEVSKEKHTDMIKTPEKR